ncbi:hypothetical protein [Humibacter sp.]|uniref:hypothetical protein n=1 Tax=Humibacter sp. TaxID=1940291 RepID=UPI003F817CDA
MRELTRYLSTTVRVFPDYAGTIIWFTMGPFDYDSARIPQDLRVAMQEWEETYYAGLDSPNAAPELVGAPEWARPLASANTPRAKPCEFISAASNLTYTTSYCPACGDETRVRTAEPACPIADPVACDDRPLYGRVAMFLTAPPPLGSGSRTD